MLTPKTAGDLRFHVSLRVSDLGRSVAFYRVLLDCEAAKLRADYAKFEIDRPPLVLSLEAEAFADTGPVSHLGFRLADSAALVDVQRRLELAGYRTLREDGVECCYAKQTKFWVQDPDGMRWELYVLQEDLEHRGVGAVPLVQLSDPASRDLAADSGCCAPAVVASVAEPVLLAFDEIRPKTLRMLDGVSEEQARWAPAGLQNTILWHAGHAYVVLESLAMDALGLAKIIPAGWFETFSWESEPAKVPAAN
jgi:catechol 2,3-dioxygenase-like lactoylglutathione lyase family enzyme